MSRTLHHKDTADRWGFNCWLNDSLPILLQGKQIIIIYNNENKQTSDYMFKDSWYFQKSTTNQAIHFLNQAMPYNMGQQYGSFVRMYALRKRYSSMDSFGDVGDSKNLSAIVSQHKSKTTSSQGYGPLCWHSCLQASTAFCETAFRWSYPPNNWGTTCRRIERSMELLHFGYSTNEQLAAALPVEKEISENKSNVIYVILKLYMWIEIWHTIILLLCMEGCVHSCQRYFFIYHLQHLTHHIRIEKLWRISFRESSINDFNY